jgi:hypothetical protein
LRAQVHTHRGAAFHSPTDDRFPIVGEAGFTSLVIPHHAASNDLDAAYLCQLGIDGRWRELAISQGLVMT